MNLQTFFAYDPNDTHEVRLEKYAIFLVAGSCCIAGLVWTAMYFFIFGWGLTTLLPLCFVVIMSTSLILSHFTRNHYYAVYSEILCIMYITAFVQWSIGGVFESGFVMAWAFIGPVTALMFLPLRKAILWFGLYLINVLITVIFNDHFSSQGQVVAENIKLFFVVMNISVSSLIVFSFAGFFVATIIQVKKREQALKQELISPNVYIDQDKMDQTVLELLDSNFFRDLEEQKKKITNR